MNGFKTLSGVWTLGIEKKEGMAKKHALSDEFFMVLIFVIRLLFTEKSKISDIQI
ncbi:hypothetical protein [Chryseobacterium sp. M5A1_1a]